MPRRASPASMTARHGAERCGAVRRGGRPCIPDIVTLQRPASNNRSGAAGTAATLMLNFICCAGLRSVLIKIDNVTYAQDLN